MKVDIVKLPKSEIELKIEVPAQEWQEFLNEAAKDLSKEIKIEGFRPGFAPFKMVEEKIGIAHIMENAAENCIKKTYIKAILDNKIEAIGQPQVSILKMAKGNPFEFKVKVAVMPEIRLPDYKKLAGKVERKKISVDEKEITEALSFVQKSRAKLNLKLEPCQVGDWVEIDYSSPQIESNRKIEDAFILGESKMVRGFEDNLVGMAENQEKKFFLTFPKDHFSKEMAGREVEFNVKMKSVKKMELPEIDDEFAKGLGNFADLADLKNSVREGIAMEKENAESERVRNVILDKIAENSQIEIPQILIIREQNRMWEDFKQSVEQKLGIKVADYLTKMNKTEKEVMDDLLLQAEKRIKNSLVLRQISKKEDVKVSDQEIKNEAQKILVKYPDLKRLDVEQLKDYTEEVLINEKTFKLLESLIKKP